jgi:FkbM family methyltransferase
MVVTHEDEGLSQELFVYGIHEPVLSVLIHNEIRKGDVIVDVGANIGYYVLIESSLVGANGKVIAIEPDPRSSQLLKENIALNCSKLNIDVFDVAIGSQKGVGRLCLSPAFNKSHMRSHIFQGKGARDLEMSINTVPLDELISNQPKIDAIRMDLEGYEFEAISGMIRTLLKFRPRLLIMELHPISNRTPILHFFRVLSDLGYLVKWAVPRSLVDGLKDVTQPLLLETLRILQNEAQYYNSTTELESQKTPIGPFAEEFLHSNQGYHVIFTPDV